MGGGDGDQQRGLAQLEHPGAVVGGEVVDLAARELGEHLAAVASSWRSAIDA